MIKRATLLLVALTSTAAHETRAQSKIPIRAVSAPSATTTQPLKNAVEGTARELPDGRLLVNAGMDRMLVLYDASLTHYTALADTMNGSAMAYSFAPRLVPYLGDSTMLLDTQSRSLVLITPTGTMGRVMAPPTAGFNGFGPGGGADSRGSLVFAQLGAQTAPPPPCSPGATPQPTVAPSLADSGLIVRASFETRTLDTIARNRGAILGQPVIVRDANCNIQSVKWPVNPMLPSVDTWTMTPKGVLAIIRGADYHMDFVYADGRKVSGPKMPFDWRRLTDENKQASIDSARRVMDSVSALGGYRARICNGTTLSGLMMQPITAQAGAGGGGGGDAAVGRGGGSRDGGRGGDPDAPAPECKWIPMTVTFPSLSEMPDYIPPIRQVAPKADLDGNVWIIPTTSLAAKNGLLYDVVNARGELVERVQLPPDRDIVAFGRRGALYLSRRETPTRVFIERVTVVR